MNRGAVPTRRKYPCPFCQKRMKRVGSVQAHIRHAHGSAWLERWVAEGHRDRLVPPRPCPVCERRLQRQTRVHAVCIGQLRGLRDWGGRRIRYRVKTLREYGDDSSSPYVMLAEGKA